MLANILSVCASITAVVCYISYVRQILKGFSIPNPATVFIWFSVGILNALTYNTIVSENIWKSLIFFTTSGLLCILFFYSLFRGKFAKFERTELLAVSMAFGIGIFWKTTGNAVVSNLLLQVIYIISFVPVLIGLHNGKLKEKSFAWVVAVVAYVFATAAILLEFDGNWLSLVPPVVTGIMGNGSVALFIVLKRKKVSV